MLNGIGYGWANAAANVVVRRLLSLLKNQKVAHWLILFNGIYAITLLPYPVFFIFGLYSQMGSKQGGIEYWIYALLLSYPIGVLLSLFCWLFYHFGKYKTAIAVANLFLIWLVPLLTLIAWLNYY
ncbi:hypothetical protein KZX70_23975 [Paenibacillus silvae]|uniref:hypothetical protein n=1 Tax=Paenibacillus silvae TaxID=1325358 RepID=UPI002005785D|nr:hypothetical protein [Paenibacillus silvae]MCK6077914.1 hypothetical protein [Paenibacillus silvae]MCK6152113.1 hypothetical protein [Paenibacillus silvae]MCK6270798.1 hypothetical protein [Paenibacillus silvae]